MATALSFWMAIGTGITAVVFAVFFDAITNGNDAQARAASTLHLSYVSHGFLVFLLTIGRIYEQLFIHLYTISCLQTR